MVQATPAWTSENFSRLASKPGVQSTLILSKADGSVLRSTGLLASSSLSTSQDAIASNSTKQDGLSELADASRNGSQYATNTDTALNKKNAEDVARMVFTFVAGAKAFTEGMDESDDIKLLRMRTRKNEIVIVPDPKFLLVVVHDASPA